MSKSSKQLERLKTFMEDLNNLQEHVNQVITTVHTNLEEDDVDYIEADLITVAEEIDSKKWLIRFKIMELEEKTNSECNTEKVA